MPEETTAPEQETTSTEGATESRMFTQDEVNEIAGKARIKERSKYADYEAIKAKAAKFDEIEEANKTEMEKLQERLKAAEDKVSAYEHDLETKQWLKEASEEFGVPADLIRGTNLEEMKAHAKTLSEYTKQNAYKPINSGSGTQKQSTITKEEIFKIQDTEERQRLIKENLHLFK